MKKFFSLLMIFTLFLSLVGCGESLDDKNPSGETVVEGGDSDCEHNFGNPEVTYENNAIKLVYECVNCGAKKTETQTVDTTLDNEVNWNESFEGFKLDNFTMKVYIGGKDNAEYVNHAIVTSDMIYYHLSDSVELYAKKNSDTDYIMYASEYVYNGENSNPQYTKKPFETYVGEFAKESFDGAKIETVLQISFANYYDKFTYDSTKGAYYCDELIAAKYFSYDGRELGTLYCYNSEVKVVDGKISSISCNYLFPEDNGDIVIPETPEYSLEYYNIGISQVSIPEEVIKNSKPHEDNKEDSNTIPNQDNVQNNQNNEELIEMVCGSWLFYNYFLEEEDGGVCEFSVGDEFNGTVYGRDYITLSVEEDGSGVYTIVGTPFDFTWIIVDYATLQLSLSDGNTYLLVIKGDMAVFMSEDATFRVTFTR